MKIVNTDDTIYKYVLFDSKNITFVENMGNDCIAFLIHYFCMFSPKIIHKRAVFLKNNLVLFKRSACWIHILPFFIVHYFTSSLSTKIFYRIKVPIHSCKNTQIPWNKKIKTLLGQKYTNIIII